METPLFSSSSSSSCSRAALVPLRPLTTCWPCVSTGLGGSECSPGLTRRNTVVCARGSRREEGWHVGPASCAVYQPAPQAWPCSSSEELSLSEDRPPLQQLGTTLRLTCCCFLCHLGRFLSSVHSFTMAATSGPNRASSSVSSVAVSSRVSWRRAACSGRCSLHCSHTQTLPAGCECLLQLLLSTARTPRAEDG